jgi:hypothetical protein
VIRFRPVLALAGALAMLLGGPLASAPPAEDPPLRYRVRPGDTLISLSTNYLSRKDDYRTIQTLNRIGDPYRLPIGSILLIPERLLRTEPVPGEIISFRGTVTVDTQPARLKMQIRQGNQIETGANSSVTVRLPDDSAITLPSQSRIRVDRLRRILLTDALDRNFRLQAGRSSSSVKRMSNPDSNFRVTTPLSVSAVRGTDFRVGFDEETGQALTETVGGLVGVAPDEEQDEVGVQRGYGVIGTKDGIQPPVPLLPSPELINLARGEGNTIVVAYKAVEGAKSYRVQLASDLAFRDIIDETLTEELGVSFPGFGSKPFFVRLTAFAPSGMEGLPRVYVSGRRGSAPDGNSAHDSGSAAGGETVQTSMTGDDRTNPALIGPGPALR